MKISRWAAASVALGLAVGALALAGPAQADLPDDIAGLTVAAEDRTGYDRDLFGDADRPAVLAANDADWPACDGYYSQADDICYAFVDFGGDPAVADDEVDVDHIVALAEAWDSGASGWTAAQLDQFAGDLDNLWLMTDNLNQSKSDKDPAEWLPPHEAATCTYIERYVAVKVEWDLAVDQTEKTELESLAAGCTTGGPGDPTDPPAEDLDCSDFATQEEAQAVLDQDPSDPHQLDGDGDGIACESLPSGEPEDETTAPGKGGEADDEGLPVTGLSTGALAVGGALLLAAGGAAYLLARRRRVSFTT